MSVAVLLARSLGRVIVSLRLFLGNVSHRTMLLLQYTAVLAAKFLNRAFTQAERSVVGFGL